MTFEGSYIEYENPQEFYNWVLSLKPKDVRDKGISERRLKKIKQKIRNGKGLKNRSKILRILAQTYKHSFMQK